MDAKSPREAEIELRFYKDKNGNYDSEKYKIIQCSLHDAGGYYIETYEEYLHTYDSEDNYEEAIKHLKQALHYNPKAVYIKVELINLYEELGEYDKAYELIVDTLGEDCLTLISEGYECLLLVPKMTEKKAIDIYEKLIKFYETGDNKDLKQWIYDTSIDGINLN